MRVTDRERERFDHHPPKFKHCVVSIRICKTLLISTQQQQPQRRVHKKTKKLKFNGEIERTSGYQLTPSAVEGESRLCVDDNIH